MKIIVKPSELIARLVWDKYAYFCLKYKSSDEISKIVAKDEEFELSEQDAFVTGFTNVIYTPELIYKYKQYLREVIENKSIDIDNKFYINKQIFITAMTDFMHKFPKNWKSGDPLFDAKLAKMDGIIEKLVENVENLKIKVIQEWPCLDYNNVKKFINKIPQ